MNPCKTILAVLLIGTCPAARAQYSLGTNDLAQTNIPGALSAFTTAAPTNQNAEVYLAMTRLLALPNQTAGSAFLTRLGIPTTGRDDYHWTAEPKTNSKGNPVVPASLTPDEFTAELRTNVVPALVASEANLAQITDQGFTLFMPGNVTHLSDVTIDYGDVQLLRAILDAAAVFGCTLHTWNLDAQFSAVSNLVADKGSVEAVLNTFPDLLTLTNAGDLAVAQGAFTNGINRYFAASQFIRSRPPGLRRLFNLDPDEVQSEQSFRNTLTSLENSLNGPVPIGSGADHLICLSNFFSGEGLRSLLPALTSNAFTFVWNSFPDSTLGGVITGLTQTNLGQAFVKIFHAQAQLSLSNMAYLVLCSPTNNLGNSLNGVTLGPDGNLYGTATYGGATGYGAFFKVTPAGGFMVLYSFGMMTNMDGSPVDGGQPSSLALGGDDNFYGTTGYGGTNGTRNGTIFRITPDGSLTTLYNFGQNNDIQSRGGNPLLSGTDGNLYGASQSGGTNGSGILFQFIPTSTAGQLTPLCSLPSSTGPNPSGNGAGAGALVQGKDGNFYGVTQTGGDNGGGSIFQFIPGANGGQFHTLYSFPVVEYPFGGQIVPGLNTLTQASNGLFYGTAQYGGDNIQNSSSGQGDGFLFCIDTSGDFTNLYSFDENQFDGFNPIGAMVQGTNGALYGITSSGGANGDGTIFKFKPDGGLKFIVWFDDGLGKQQGGQNGGNFGGFNSIVDAGLIKGLGGFLGTDPNGGQHGNGTVFSLSANSAASIVTSPLSTTNVLGASVVLTASASGTPLLGYQWVKNGQTLQNSPPHVTGVTTTSLTLAVLTSADAGSYALVVTNAYGSDTSGAAVLTVVPPPTIITQPKAAVSLLQGMELNLQVGALGSGLTYRWRTNNVNLADGANISGSGSSNLVINPALINNSGNYSVVVSNSFGGTNSKVAVVTVAADKTPAVAITSPAASGGRSNAPVTFSGTASEAGPAGNVPITSVNYTITNLNGLHSSPVTQGQASLSAGPASTSPSNWTVSLSLPGGSNIFTARSVDFSGNLSPVASLKFFLNVPVPLAVNIAGTGRGTLKGTSFISGDTVPANGAMLNVGEAYSITATPDANSFFTGWTSSAGDTNGPTLNFIMQSNTSLTANFITNMFLGMAGTYNGLFPVDPFDATVETAGMISGLKLATNGVFSATVNLDGSAPGISGTFSPEGHWSNLVSIALEKNVAVVLQVNANSAPRMITGVVIGTNAIWLNGRSQPGWGSEVALFASLTNSSRDAVNYTMVIPPAPNSNGTNSPPGYGYALLTNNPGTAAVLPSFSLTGVLADGTAISPNAQIGEDNAIAVFLNPYSGAATGLLFGRLGISNSPAVPGPSGFLTWIKKASSSGWFKAGFTNTFLQVGGSPWINSGPPMPPGSQLTLKGGGLAMPLALGVSVIGTNLVPTSATPKYNSGSINTNNGQLTITFTNNANATVTGHGVLLQDYQFGGGFYGSPAANPTNFGSIIWEP